MTNTLALPGFVVLLLTLLAIIWYSVETRWLRQETAAQRREVANQTELQNRPLLTLLYKFGPNDFVLFNLGNGAAREITFAYTPLNAKNHPEGTDSHVHLRLEAVDYALPKIERSLNATTFVQDQGEQVEIPDGHRGWVSQFGKNAPGPRTVIARYSNLAGTRYETKVEISAGFSRILEDKRL